MEGTKQHIKIQSTLPCGWVSQVLLDKGNGQGYAAWRVLPAPDEWQKVVQEGLQSQAPTF